MFYKLRPLKNIYKNKNLGCQLDTKTYTYAIEF